MVFNPVSNTINTIRYDENTLENSQKTVFEKVLSMKTGIWIIVGMSLVSQGFAQAISEEEALAKALAGYPTLQIADHRLRMQESLQRSAFNPTQPQLTFEFPNDIGLAFELRQEFDFPGVYSSRAKWLKTQTRQQAEAIKITRQELIRDVRTAYLEAQLAQSLVQILTQQDSLWSDLDKSTKRLYDGGHINKADELFSSKQAGLISNKLARAQIDAANALAGLALYLNEPVQEVEVLERFSFAEPDTTVGFYFDQYLEAGREVAEHALAVSKAERLPGIIVGYLRVPELDTDYRSRFHAGLTVPIWQGQYKSEVTATRIALETVESETDLQRRQAQTMRQQLSQTLIQTNDALNWYESTALPQTDALISTYRRLYEGGEVDYALTLRNIADALDIYTEYLETMKRYNEAVITLEFLHGQ